MIRYDRQNKPGLVVLYDIWPGNVAGQFLQTRSSHGALGTRARLGGLVYYCGNASDVRKTIFLRPRPWPHVSRPRPSRGFKSTNHINLIASMKLFGPNRQMFSALILTSMDFATTINLLWIWIVIRHLSLVSFSSSSYCMNNQQLKKSVLHNTIFTVQMKKRSERRKHCTLAVVRWSQKFSPHRRPHSRRCRTAKI